MAVSERLTERFGAPVKGRSGRNYDTRWRVSPRVAIEVGVSDRPDEEGIFSITLAQAP